MRRNLRLSLHLIRYSLRKAEIYTLTRYKQRFGDHWHILSLATNILQKLPPPLQRQATIHYSLSKCINQNKTIPFTDISCWCTWAGCIESTLRTVRLGKTAAHFVRSRLLNFLAFLKFRSTFKLHTQILFLQFGLLLISMF